MICKLSLESLLLFSLRLAPLAFQRMTPVALTHRDASACVSLHLRSAPRMNLARRVTVLDHEQAEWFGLFTSAARAVASTIAILALSTVQRSDCRSLVLERKLR